jgi:hypothetical protein
VSATTTALCVNCDHDAHDERACTGDADGEWCACSWPDPGNFVEQPRLRIAHVTWRTAKAFVGAEHRHHPPSQGHFWSTGVFDGDRMCGVAVIGRPVSRMLQDAGDIEVLRVCTDGTPNACSALYGAAARQAVSHGWRRDQLLTYILESEPGTSLRAAGWVYDGTSGGGEWGRPSRARGVHAPTEPKQRWRASRRSESHAPDQPQDGEPS